MSTNFFWSRFHTTFYRTASFKGSLNGYKGMDRQKFEITKLKNVTRSRMFLFIFPPEESSSDMTGKQDTYCHRSEALVN
jgi:hypothetical protein